MKGIKGTRDQKGNLPVRHGHQPLLSQHGISQCRRISLAPPQPAAARASCSSWNMASVNSCRTSTSFTPTYTVTMPNLFTWEQQLITYIQYVQCIYAYLVRSRDVSKIKKMKYHTQYWTSKKHTYMQVSKPGFSIYWETLFMMLLYDSSSFVIQYSNGLLLIAAMFLVAAFTIFLLSGRDDEPE